jgi:hypothetical protein
VDELVPPYPLIRERLAEGRVIPFLGAGASLGGRTSKATWKKGTTSFLPTGSELAKHLAATTQFPSDHAAELATVAQYFSVIGGRSGLQEELRTIFNTDYPLTSLHAYLASIAAPLLIITTNYDDLIERALRKNKRPYDLVVHTTDTALGDRLLWTRHGELAPQEVLPNKLAIDLKQVTVVYKMHGAVDRDKSARDQYVITEDDYIDFLVRMMKNKAIPSIFAEPLLSRHFLFLGYGLYDWNLRVVLSRVANSLDSNRQLKSWAIQYKPSALERRFWQNRGVEIFDMLLDDFVLKLAAKANPAPKKGRRS